MKMKKIAAILSSAIIALTMIVFADFSDVLENVVNTATVSAEGDKTVEFLNSGFDTDDLIVYDGTDTSKSFNMNGRTYYQGLQFNCYGYQSYAQFNVENINTLSFTMGHVDGTELTDATLAIYLDGNGEDEIELSSLMKLTPYELNVSGASVVRFEFNDGYGDDASYALADLLIDQNKPLTSYAIPMYETAEAFMQSGFNTDDLVVYDGSSKTNSFNMNGRTYYQGLQFNCYGYQSYAQFNVENINTLSFTMGHVDGTELTDATLTIYFDGKGEAEISMSSLMNLTPYELNVSGASVVRFEFNDGYGDDASYALADLSVDDYVPTVSCSVPQYETAEAFMQSGFNTDDLAVYDGSSKTNSFNMNGRTYYQGLKFNCYGYQSYAQFNVENINTLSFTMGHVDGTELTDATLTIYFDGKGEAEISMSSLMNLTPYELNVSGASVVRFEFNDGYGDDASYALADLSVDSYAPAVSCSVPQYETAEAFMQSGFNTDDLAVYDGSSKTDSFNMNGKTYYQGLKFNCYGYKSYAQFNVENIHDISFSMGHIDGTELTNATLTIYLDNEKSEEIQMTADMMTVNHTIDVKNSSVVRFVFDDAYGDDASYAFADVSIETCPYADSSEICTTCGRNCEHSYENGVCGICDTECSHPAYVDGICTICSSVCEHKFSGDKCEICGSVCEHTYTMGVCENCGLTCIHENVTDGKCDVCAIFFGDANLDGKINVRDAAAIASALANGTVSTVPVCADYNRDGSINVRDAAAIAKWLSGSK